MKAPTSWLGEAFTKVHILSYTVIKEESEEITIFKSSYRWDLTTGLLRELKKQGVAFLKGRKIEIPKIKKFAETMLAYTSGSQQKPKKIKTILKDSMVEEVLELHESSYARGFVRV